MSFIEQLPSKEGMRRLRKEAREKNPKPRGRPIGWRKNKEEVSYTTVRINKSLKDTIDHSRKSGESTTDTIQRIITDSQLKVMELRQEVERLKSNQNMTII
jgi:hypothetical protein